MKARDKAVSCAVHASPKMNSECGKMKSECGKFRAWKMKNAERKLILVC